MRMIVVASIMSKLTKPLFTSSLSICTYLRMKNSGALGAVLRTEKREPSLPPTNEAHSSEN